MVLSDTSYLDKIGYCPFRSKCQNYEVCCDDTYFECDLFRKYLQEFSTVEELFELLGVDL